MRDDFSSEIIRSLQYQSAFICSSPDCKRLTVAPSIEAIDKFQYIGIAAHITAASVDGPRYDSTLTSEQRKDISNAIFLCSNCAAKIDKNNGIDYPAPLLRDWKQKHLSWVLANLNQSVIKEATILNTLANFNQQGGQNINYLTINNFTENQPDSNKEHDKLKFQDLERILSERKLLQIFQSLIDDASCQAKEQDLLTSLLAYLGQTGNGFINVDVDLAKDQFIDTLQALLDMFWEFDKYPYSQNGDDYRIEFCPSLLHSYHQYSPSAEDRKKWQQKFAVFKNKVEEVLTYYKAFRRNVKISLQV